MLVTHVMINKGNVCQYYSDVKCSDDKGIDYKFPQEEFGKYLVTLKDDPELKGFENLIPTN